MNRYYSNNQYFWGGSEKRGLTFGGQQFDPPNGATGYSFQLPTSREEYSLTSISRITQAVSEAYSASEEMCLGTYLAAINACIRGKVGVKVTDDWYQPTNLFMVQIADSGSGKTPVNEFFKRPILEFQKQWNAENKDKLYLERVKLEQYKKRMKQLERKASKIDDVGEVDRYQQEIVDILKKMDTMSGGHELAMFVDDITNKSLIEALAQQKGRVAVMEAEASVFRHIVNAKPTSPIVDTLLKVFSGEPIQFNRSGECPISIEQPTLALNTMVQPSVIAHLARNKAIMGRGLIGRILFSVANGPHRPITTNKGVEASIRSEYTKIIHTILDRVEGTDGRIILNIDEDAKALFDRWSTTYKIVVPSPDSIIRESIRMEFIGKLLVHTINIAALISISDAAYNHESINIEAMRHAICIFGHYGEMFQKVLEMMIPDHGEKQALFFLSKIKYRSDINIFQSRDLQRMFRLKAREAENAIGWLLDRAAITPYDQVYAQPTGRPRNPEFLIDRRRCNELISQYGL